MNRFINYYKKIFSQEYMDRTISGGIKSQLTLLLVTIATVLAIFFIIVMFFSIQLYGHEEWGERLWVVYNNFVDPGNQMNETAWSSRLLLGIVSFSGSIFIGRCAHLYHFQHYRAACGCSKHGANDLPQHNSTLCIDRLQ